MKQLILLALTALMLSAPAAPPGYSLSIPGAPTIRMTNAVAANEWLASNPVASVSATFGGSVTNRFVSKSDIPGLNRYTLQSPEVGFSVERIKPEVWLGDALQPPDNIAIDWNATYAGFLTNELQQTQFIFDNHNKRVYVQAGGNITFTWIAADGSEFNRSYIASSSASGRPYKMFWTEAPWNAPVIDLSGKFVKLFGPKDLITPQYGERETDKGGHLVVESNVVVRGVYYDSSVNTLSAYGRVSGQFILAYYDSGSFDELKHLQVIEVGEPDVNTMKGYIGEAIKPHGSGYSTEGFWPSPVSEGASSSLQNDEFGDYFYQHKGMYSYSPKHNAIFPLRDTSEAPWRLDVYWMESDAFGVNWPFERSQYSCTWNTNAMPVLVAGESIKFAEDYTVELVKYQTPNGHARAPENKVFSTTADGFASVNEVGFSCLKLSAPDNVWFLPVRTVSRENADFFTLQEEEWPVGTELTVRGGSVSGTTEKFRPVIDASVSGVIRSGFSGTHYNPELYYDWRLETRNDPSVIYAVNTSADAPSIEVCWFTSVQESDMPAKISIPTLVQRYRIVYPETTEAPQIVIASQQGSACESVFESGNALYFNSAASTAGLPDRHCFRETEGTLSFWANACEFSGSGRLITLGNGDKTFAVSASSSAEGVMYSLKFVSGETEFAFSSLPLLTSAWHRVTFSFSGTNATVYTDGKVSHSSVIAAADFSGFFTANAIGAVKDESAPKGLIVDDVVVAAIAISPAVAASQYLVAPDASLADVMMCLTFENGDLEPQFGSDKRRFTEEVSKSACTISGALLYTPGAPEKGNGVFQSDTQPVVYRQNDPDLPGYNPNEEHAFIDSGHGGYFAWALRCDLNRDSTSRAGVLVQYSANGRPRMQYFPVVLTNETYAALAGTATVGTVLPGPHPLDLFDNPWLRENYWDDVAGQNDSPAFPDRKHQVWSRSAGVLPIHMYYPNQDGFDFPGATSAPAVGAAIPWLSCLDGYDSSRMLSGAPVVWKWMVEWPANVETMKIGQTLTTAADGLPEVWNSKSVAVVYPDDGGRTALVWDPTVIRHASVPESLLSSSATPAALLKTFGFDPAQGNVALRAGKYTFKDLPPSIGDRFFVNANLAVADCICLKGELETNAGGSILYPNVLNESEAAALKALVPAENSAKSQWDALIASLPRSPIEPTSLSVENGKAKVDYVAKDHYALTAMGATNYVVLIENDATNSLMKVEDGDPISMHVFKVAPEYYAGRVVTREDPLNLLSQQLGILYSESFAGKADDYEFEWKKSTPAANGSMPGNYEQYYRDVFDKTKWGGLTRFTIGQQGDTLANLVNTYYVMRYRAKKDTAPYAVMGEKWSDWCGPALAEGWIQRCVNNVTPFTQRMTDLYENEAETTASMVAQAGKPWTGDVSLNQDNLTEIGLIELYQTLLNKAETMSLTLGLNDADANNQLLLAAERLCDLYVLLGNEAYADALNPTIGFGTDWTSVAAGTTQIDYGFESTGLFCFDNQVPSLLDEELALLRGRTGANNPSVTVAPCYNRLVWNFTRGITAGEVAYAVNYNINSTDKDADIDEDDAAKQYPQGHGDAWGHYLSAMNVWYRLLRNPYFSWSAAQMQMNVADNVVDVDYYDEERFAETAGKLAKTAADIVDRTAKKSWRDNKGAKMAGYLDSDTGRNFGYGEWATRGGIGGIMNWMVANSLLPEAESAGRFYLAGLAQDSRMSLTNAPVSLVDGAWTFECHAITCRSSGTLFEMTGTETAHETLKPDAAGNDWLGVCGKIVLSANADGTCAVSAGRMDYSLVSVTNVTYASKTNENVAAGTPVYSVEYLSKGAFKEELVQSFALPSNAIIAVSCSDAGDLTLGILAADGTQKTRIELGRLPMDNPSLICGGNGYSGAIGELRFWRGVRTNEELHDSRTYVNERDSNLLAYTRGISASKNVDSLPDETPGGEHEWHLSSPEWIDLGESGIDIAFDDDGLLRINRSTTPSLAEIPSSVAQIQKNLDRLDSGMNPLGLSDGALAMDISSAGVQEGTSTHFEQIAARAETALGNAVKVLDRAQEAARHLRTVQNSQATIEETAETSEADYTRRLIEIYGTPYEDDIGPAGTYPQGYEGPDLYHYMYMDLELFGVTGADNLEPVSVATFDSSEGWTFKSMKKYMEGAGNSSEKKYSYQISANGLVVKPDSIKGTRRSCGKIQDAYTNYILAWVDLKNLYDTFNGQKGRLADTIKNISSLRDANKKVYEESYGKWCSTIVTKTSEMVLKYTKNSLDIGAALAEDSDNYASKVADKGIVGAGFTMVVNPVAIIYSTVGSFLYSAKATFKSLASVNQIALDEIANTQALVDNEAEWAAAQASWNAAQKSAFEEARSAIIAVAGTAQELNAAWARMVSEAENFDTIVSEGDRIQQERAAARARRVNRIVKLRYNDMFFRQVQDESLTRYSQAFNLAQKYVYMAAQTYDYETGLLAADKESGDAFRAEVIGARALGKFADDGSPLLGSASGDAGLSDILARMKANYSVLKGRLGINNPDKNATWFSLRKELLRISGGAEGDGDWMRKLAGYVVEDIRSVPEYQRYCQPIASSSSLLQKEPAIVIPFSTTIDFAKNFFGNDLAAGDHQLDSSYFATKIASAGVKFEGYPSSALGATPNVYLVPTGQDRMRVPGGGEDATVLCWNVVDQVISVPYKIGSAELDDADWQPLHTLYTGGADFMAKIRRMPSFRAMTGSSDDGDRTNSRLIGRSAWNSRWVMIIPAGSLLGGAAEDRAKALSIFIDGNDADRDGIVETPGVKDILLGLKTYATSGN